MIELNGMSKGLRVLSLFDGMGSGWIALQELGIPVDTYYASEVDKFAIRQTKMNFPDIVHLGDVRDIEGASLGHIDLILAGSPCQSLSFAGKRNGFSTVDKEEVLTLERYLELKGQNFEFEGESYLFWEFIRILHEVRVINPDVYFLLENVEMGQKWENVFDTVLGLKGVHINSALVSAQNRRRIYWSNIRTCERSFWGDLYTDIPQPKDRRIYLRDVLEEDVDEKYYLSEKMLAWLNKHSEKKGNPVNMLTGDDKSHCLTVSSLKMNCDTDYVCVAARGRGEDNSQKLEHRSDGKTNCLTTVSKDNMISDGRLRVLTPTEYARLQTVPDWYSWEGTSATQIRRMCGNGWTIEVIKHILSYLKKVMVNLEELEEKLNESLENETSESLTEFVEARGICVKELEEVFEGRGEVKGFTFTQLHRTEYVYMYEQKEEVSGHITYEVFRRRVNAQFGCVSYPKSNGFGDSAYMGKTFRSLDKAMAYFEYLNDYCQKKSLEVS